MCIRWLYKVSGGKWRSSHGERCLYYSHATVNDSYTPCAISGRASHTLFNLQLLYQKKNIGKVTEMDGYGRSRTKGW